MADYSQLMNLEKQQKKQPLSPGAQHRPSQQSTTSSTEQSPVPSSDRFIDQSMKQSTRNQEEKVMEKPRGFYITERLNHRIDEAVRYYQEKHHLKKVDRSIVVTVLLENEANWTEEALDVVLDRVINQLTNRLVNR